MNNESNGNEYILFFRGEDWTKGMSTEQIQTVMTQVKGWFDRLATQSKFKAAQPLELTGKVISGKNGRVVKDGPYTESKEIVGGYLLLTVDSMDEAVAIAKTNPMLEYGGVVEVRQVAAECPSARAALKGEGELAHAAA
jgi:hypothetical protein